MPPPTPNKERDYAVLQGLRQIGALWQMSDPTNQNIKEVSVTLRLLLIDGEITRAAAPFRKKLLINTPDNSSLAKRIKPSQSKGTKRELRFFQGGGALVLGTEVRNICAFDLGGHRVEFSVEARAEKNIQSSSRSSRKANLRKFLNQPVFCFQDVWVRRSEVIKYVANKTGLVHFDEKREGTDRTLDYIRNVISIRIENGIPSFGLNIDSIDSPSGEFFVRPEVGDVDPVLVELLSCCRFLDESQTVDELQSNLIKVHNF